MVKSNSIDDVFYDFKLDLQRKGYKLQGSNQFSDLYGQGARFIYVLPDALWMGIKKSGVKTSEEPITQIFTKINPELTKHVKTFYEHARASAEKLRRKLIATEPTFATGGVLVIYCGMKNS